MVRRGTLGHRRLPSLDPLSLPPHKAKNQRTSLRWLTIPQRQQLLKPLSTEKRLPLLRTGQQILLQQQRYPTRLKISIQTSAKALVSRIYNGLLLALREYSRDLLLNHRQVISLVLQLLRHNNHKHNHHHCNNSPCPPLLRSTSNTALQHLQLPLQ